ncbi:DUF6691 family protein [Mycetohabitans sp. B46]|uniref:DUF6691 family protein n=1 Tax=Mycetohabitans sp. B46 TaxID=2772536 RepID=UPI00307F48D6
MRACSLLGPSLQLPASEAVASRRVPGSAAFGIGCRLTGCCPEPTLVTLSAGYPKAKGFMAAMMANMAIFKIISQRESDGWGRAERGALHD